MNHRSSCATRVICRGLSLAATGFSLSMNSISQAAPVTPAPVPVPVPAAVPVAVSAHERALQGIVDDVVKTVSERFKAQKLGEEQLSISLIDLSTESANGAHPSAHFRGEAPTYPASVVKLFYLAAVERWLEDGELTNSPELQRALRDMIVDSSNDATSLVVDALSGVGSGPELQGEEWETWKQKRNVVNRFFAELGYRNQNIN
ncbi:MAG: hypothetical protein JWN98_2502, partial [Abditibacteriota bacterium]|nr:hypothetical protein [Abditibacteriota bacterium]